MVQVAIDFFFIIVYTGGEGHSHSPISFRARVQIAKPLLRSTELRQGTCSEFRGGTGGILVHNYQYSIKLTNFLATYFTILGVKP